ncbi:hypothetical protein BSFP_049170 [Burkholderia stabilis]|uniref:Uncharacterized protein n=1 Tax=Burkholderia stabilis TaxID=95485 RepID=A0A1Y1BPZ2_9BURK|nr:hypothetical protein BSFP_049170 [Burkholderia stabilis]
MKEVIETRTVIANDHLFLKMSGAPLFCKFTLAG